MPGRKFGIAVDGSEISLKAFNYFLDNVYRAEDSCVLIIVTEYNLSVGVVPNAEAIGKAVQEQEEKFGNMSGKLTDELKRRNIPGKVVRGSGKPGEAILKIAQEQSVEALVMGTRGLGAFKRTVLGSVSDFVLRNSNIPVTIVPSS